MCKELTPSEETRALRHTLGQFPTGVAVAIAKTHEDELVGMTINSFSSVSMIPPLVTWCIDRKAASYCTFANCKKFSLTVLADNQTELALRFATRGADKFKDIVLDQTGNTPALAGGSAILYCINYRSLLMGDHLVMVGLVVHHQQLQPRPLVFAQGQFQQLTDIQEQRERVAA